MPKDSSSLFHLYVIILNDDETKKDFAFPIVIIRLRINVYLSHISIDRVKHLISVAKKSNKNILIMFRTSLDAESLDEFFASVDSFIGSGFNLNIAEAFSSNGRIINSSPTSVAGFGRNDIFSVALRSIEKSPMFGDKNSASMVTLYPRWVICRDGSIDARLQMGLFAPCQFSNPIYNCSLYQRLAVDVDGSVEAKADLATASLKQGPQLTLGDMLPFMKKNVSLHSLCKHRATANAWVSMKVNMVASPDSDFLRFGARLSLPSLFNCALRCETGGFEGPAGTCALGYKWMGNLLGGSARVNFSSGDVDSNAGIGLLGDDWGVAARLGFGSGVGLMRAEVGLQRSDGPITFVAKYALQLERMQQAILPEMDYSSTQIRTADNNPSVSQLNQPMENSMNINRSEMNEMSLAAIYRTSLPAAPTPLLDWALFPFFWRDSKASDIRSRAIPIHLGLKLTGDGQICGLFESRWPSKLNIGVNMTLQPTQWVDPCFLGSVSRIPTFGLRLRYGCFE